MRTSGSRWCRRSRRTFCRCFARTTAFAGYLALYDPDKSRARAIILWETEEAGVAAEETLAERRRQISGGLGLTIESQDLYEGVVVEFERARIS